MIRAALLIVALGGIAACTPLRGHQGYIADVDLVNSIQPGVDTKQTVQQVLGRPTVAGQFADSDWYYVGRDTRNLAYNDPKPITQIALRVRFDQAGVVRSIDRTGVEQIASINPSNDKTPTLGRKRGFFDDLFGNIGTVGATGAPASGGGTP